MYMWIVLCLSLRDMHVILNSCGLLVHFMNVDEKVWFMISFEDGNILRSVCNRTKVKSLTFTHTQTYTHPHMKHDYHFPLRHFSYLSSSCTSQMIFAFRCVISVFALIREDRPMMMLIIVFLLRTTFFHSHWYYPYCKIVAVYLHLRI